MKLEIISVIFQNTQNQRVRIQLREDSFIGNYGLLIDSRFLWFEDMNLKNKDYIDVLWGDHFTKTQEQGIVIYAPYLGTKFVLFELKNWQYVERKV